MNRLLSIFSLLLFTCSIFAQELVVPEKKIYISAQGKMFIHKSLPLFFKLTYSPDDTSTGAFLIKEGANMLPVYLKNEGLNIFSSPSAVDPVTRKLKLPKEDVVFEVYADSKAPVSKLEINKSNLFTQKDRTFLPASSAISMSSFDETSGVGQILYSIDSVSFKPFTEPIMLTSEKEYLIKYYAYDNVGNIEPLKSFKFAIDKTSPITTFEIKGDRFNNIVGRKAKINFKSADNSSGLHKISVNIDGRPIANFSGTIDVSYLSQGEHKLEFFATDKVNNQEPAQTFNFYVDRTPPTILQEIVGKSFMSNGREYSSGQSQLKITTLDNRAGVKAIYYSINHGKYQLYEKPVLLSAKKGDISIRAYAVDNVNNQSEVTDEASSVNFSYIDLSGPVLKHQFLGPHSLMYDTMYISSKTAIQLMGYDPDAGFNTIEYAVGRDKATTYKGAFSIPAEGYFTVGYTGYDNVDNTSLSSFNVMVDNTGPQIFHCFSSPVIGSTKTNDRKLDVFPNHVCLFLSAFDLHAGFSHFTYSINGGKWKEFSGMLTGFDKVNNVSIKAYDKLGNVSEMIFEFALFK